MDYWNDLVTEKSWMALLEFRKESSFVLIGGWAVWLYVKTHKSKDIDIIANFDELEGLRKKFDLKKNVHLKKYEIHLNEIDVDIYVPFYSKLALPVEKILKETTSIEGFKVPKPEILLILKQGAEIERGTSEKGLKDRIDLMQLMLKTEIDFKKYSKILKENNLMEYRNKLIQAIQNFSETKYLNLNLVEFKKAKTKLLEKIKQETK